MTEQKQDNRDTRERILDAAERLFARQGFDASSMRTITADAGVNVAAVHYHFGSKEALIEEVFHRRLGPLNDERLQRLDALEGQDGAVPSLEQLVEAFVGPALRVYGKPECGGPVFTRLLGHALGQPHGPVRELFTHQFQEVFGRFTSALQDALPELPRTEIVWRFLFMVGAMAHTMALSGDIARMSGDDPLDIDGTIRRLVPFLCAGLRAPLPAAVRGD
jgi:AcrR family transcriptional regulator